MPVWENSSLNPSAFTSRNGCIVVTRPVAQPTHNIQIVPDQASIPIRRLHLSDKSGNAIQPLASISVPQVSQSANGNAPAYTKISQESLQRAIRIEEDYHHSAEPDNHDNSNLIYHNTENEARFDPEAAANAEQDDNELEIEINLDLEDEVAIANHTGRRQIRSDIHSQINVISSNGYEYFSCNTCKQLYNSSVATKNISNHLLKDHGWTSLTKVQNNRKWENQSIKDVMKRMGLAVEERKDPIRKELLNGNLDQKTLKYLYIQNVIQCNLPFSLLPNHTFCTSLQFVNLIANELLLNSGSTIQVRVMSLYEKWQH